MVKEVKGAVTTNYCQWDSEISFYPRRNFGSQLEVSDINLIFAKLDALDQQLDRYEIVEVYATGATNISFEICGQQGHQIWTIKLEFLFHQTSKNLKNLNLRLSLRISS